jgi:hypothetical protein
LKKGLWWYFPDNNCIIIRNKQSVTGLIDWNKEMLK